MSELFTVEILSPVKEVAKMEASEVLLPSSRGELGILPDHEDLVGLLSTGTLKITHQDKEDLFVVSGGAFKVENASLTIFAEYGINAVEIDASKTDQEISKLEESLKNNEDTHTKENIDLRNKISILYAKKRAAEFTSTNS